MNSPPILLLVASCHFASFIHCTNIKGDLESYQVSHPVIISSFQSIHNTASSSGTSLNNEISLADKTTPDAWSQPDVPKPNSLPHRTTSTAVDSALDPVMKNLVANTGPPKKGFSKIIDSFNGLIKRILFRLKIRKDPPFSFSERFRKNKIRYTPVTVASSRGEATFRTMSMDYLTAAHKEIAGLGAFYERIMKETTPLGKAEILGTSMDAFKKMPTDQIKPSDCAAWLQTIAAIMGVGKEQREPDVLMEATAQFGLLDLMTKFERGLESTAQYHSSVESLQVFLKLRFSLIKDAPGLKEKAYDIPWASEVLYDDYRVNLNSDLPKFVKWLKADQTLGETINHLNSARSDIELERLIDDVATTAAMSNKETSSREKSAATILLCILGTLNPADSKLTDQASSSMKTEAFNSMKRKARFAMNDSIDPKPGRRAVDSTRFLVLPNNARRVKQFQEIYDFPNELLNPRNFKEIILQSEGVEPTFSALVARYSKMNSKILKSQIDKDPDLTRFFEFREASDLMTQLTLLAYMNKLKSPLMSQMTLPKFVVWIQAIAEFMNVASKTPRDERLEEIARSSLLQIMEKRWQPDSETMEFSEAASELHRFLEKRRMINQIEKGIAQDLPQVKAVIRNRRRILKFLGNRPER